MINSRCFFVVVVSVCVLIVFIFIMVLLYHKPVNKWYEPHPARVIVTTMWSYNCRRWLHYPSLLRFS